MWIPWASRFRGGKTGRAAWVGPQLAPKKRGAGSLFWPANPLKPALHNPRPMRAYDGVGQADPSTRCWMWVLMCAVHVLLLVSFFFSFPNSQSFWNPKIQTASVTASDICRRCHSSSTNTTVCFRRLPLSTPLSATTSTTETTISRFLLSDRRPPLPTPPFATVALHRRLPPGSIPSSLTFHHLQTPFLLMRIFFFHYLFLQF